MPRKSILMSEESSDSVPDSPLRRSTRSRAVHSPAPQVAPVARTRRSSTSSVGSDISAASLPANTKVVARTRRPSLTLESNLEKIGEAPAPVDILTPVKKTRAGSNSGPQHDDCASAVRAGSPVVTTVTNRRRSLRSASKSPTLVKESATDGAVINVTPSKVRGRRSSADKVPSKRRGSVVLEPLDEEHEPDSPKKKATLSSVSEDTGEGTQVENLVKTSKKQRLSSDKASNNLPSHSTDDKLQNLKQKQVLTEKLQRQLSAETHVVISPITNKIRAEKLSEMVDLISVEHNVRDQINKSKIEADIISLKASEEIPKRLSSQSPIRRSPRLIIEAPSPVSKESTPDIKSPIKTGLNLDKTPEVIDGSDGSFHITLKTSILSSREDELNKSKYKSAEFLNSSNESDKENAPKRASNVFTATNLEGSFCEAMDVEYPSDHDESLSIANQKQSPTDKHEISDDSTSGSLHLICSDDEKLADSPDVATLPNRQSIALIQLDSSSVVTSPAFVRPEELPISSILDSRISILPSKTLTPIVNNEEAVKLDSAQISCDEFPIQNELDEGKEVQNSPEPRSESPEQSPMQDKGTSDKIEVFKIGLEMDEGSDDESTKLDDLVFASSDSSDSEYQPKSEELTLPKTIGVSRKSGEFEHVSINLFISPVESKTASKLDKLIQNKTMDYDEDSDSSRSDFLDDKALEVSDEESPSDDSCDIIETGEDIENTDDDSDEEQEDEESDADFIDDSVDDVVLLSGHEDDDDLDYDGKQVIVKKGRILTRPVDESDDESEVPETSTVKDLANKLKSSITIQEHIKIGEDDKSKIIDKIGNIVDLFCSSFTDNTGGNVTVNLSLDYNKSSNDAEDTPSAESSQKIKILQEVRIPREDLSINVKPKNRKNKTNRSPVKSIDDEVFLPDSSSHSKSEQLLKTPKPSCIGNLPDNVIMELVRDEEGTSKSTPLPSKSGEKQRKNRMNADEIEMFCKPSTSNAESSAWTVSDSTPNTKPSKCNARKLAVEGVIDMKDFKNIMIAKNKLKPKQPNKGFIASLKTQKKF